MQVVEDEQALFALVSNFLVDVRFVNPAGHGTCEEGAVVDSAHVVASSTESEWNPKDKYSGVNPRWMVPGRKAEKIPFQYIGGEDWRHDGVMAVKTVRNRSLGCVDEEAPESIDHSRSEPNAHSKRLAPPVVDTVGTTQSVDNGKFDAVAHDFTPYPPRGGYVNPNAQGL